MILMILACDVVSRRSEASNFSFTVGSNVAYRAPIDLLISALMKPDVSN